MKKKNLISIAAACVLFLFFMGVAAFSVDYGPNTVTIDDTTKATDRYLGINLQARVPQQGPRDYLRDMPPYRKGGLRLRYAVGPLRRVPQGRRRDHLQGRDAQELCHLPHQQDRRGADPAGRVPGLPYPEKLNGYGQTPQSYGGSARCRLCRPYISVVDRVSALLRRPQGLRSR